jgi:hypothetical protein
MNRMQSIALLVVAGAAISAATEIAFRRDSDRATLEMLLRERLGELALGEPAEARLELKQGARRWRALARRYPESQLAWELSDASIAIGSEVVEDSSGVRKLILWGNGDDLEMLEPRLLLTSVSARMDDGADVPVCWCGALADSGDRRWYHQEPLARLFPELAPGTHVLSLACTTRVLPRALAHEGGLDAAGVHAGALPSGWIDLADEHALRTHARTLADLNLPAPSTAP